MTASPVEPVSVRAAWLAGDYRRRAAPRLVVFAILLMCAPTLWVVSDGTESLGWFSLVYFGILCVLSAGRTLRIPELPVLDCSFDAEGVRWIDDRGSTSFHPWAAIRTARLHRRFVVFDFRRGLPLFLPRHAFTADDLAHLEALLASTAVRFWGSGSQLTTDARERWLTREQARSVAQREARRVGIGWREPVAESGRFWFRFTLPATGDEPQTTLVVRAYDGRVTVRARVGSRRA